MQKILFLLFLVLISVTNSDLLAQERPKFLFDTVVAKNDQVIIKDTLAVNDSTKQKDTLVIQRHIIVKKDTTPVEVTIDPYKVTTYMYEIPFKRRYFHEDKIDKELKRADASDGIIDNQIRYKTDTALSKIITKAILKDGNFLQVMVENMPANGRDSFADHQERIRCLNAVYNMLRNFNTDPSPDPIYYKKVVANMHDMLIAYNEDKFASFCVKNTNYITLDNGRLLFDNYKEVRAYMYTTLGKADPKKMIKRLGDFANDTFAGPIIADVAITDPDIVYNYATSTNAALTDAVHRTANPLVQSIVKIADGSKAPLKALCFLGDIYHKRKTVAQIDVITADEDLFYKNLIRLKVTEEPIAKYTYTQEAAHRALRYIREMNELHESSDAVRFKIIEGLSHVELYNVMVYGQDEIYTSSFLGSFKRLLDKMKPMKGNQLLDSLHYDHFRTFIRMCAGYNTLSEFLYTMDDSSRITLMSGFIRNLQKGREDDLEDAVDVADAFGSITDTALSAFLQNQVKESYEQSFKERSKKGMVIYSLLSRLFDGNKISDSDTGANVVSARLGLPNINKVAFKDLVNDSGTVYQQVFFFGDEDGKHSYEHFTDLFRKDKRWKMATNANWTTISSVTGRKVVIYANLPLPDQEAEAAIDKTTKFLTDTGIHPSIMIHRGHSYHLKSTMERLDKSARIIILGSCGGYQNLAGVLNKSPNAHIVSSKQTGTMGVNDEILRSLNNSLIEGKDINWINMWQGLEVFFNKKRDAADKDKFSDYVPPYKNLGAIFIKAYRHMMEGDGK
ncbi:hypothetical protein [Flavipsychrobacter stenotrophus]|uniref:hypothetical protein n=1 Tax=Flavipsychrobacter stenotrophus TaxID=2077091 RepID=UPI000CF3E7E9|nr:hypothetical protein [Flavipsychrobacter stenotrophus]